ncbi:hypothetical protein EJB05_09434, partial [Eragrostis curvula]
MTTIVYLKVGSITVSSEREEHHSTPLDSALLEEHKEAVQWVDQGLQHQLQHKEAVQQFSSSKISAQPKASKLFCPGKRVRLHQARSNSGPFPAFPPPRRPGRKTRVAPSGLKQGVKRLRRLRRRGPETTTTWRQRRLETTTPPLASFSPVSPWPRPSLFIPLSSVATRTRSQECQTKGPPAPGCWPTPDELVGHGQAVVQLLQLRRSVT